jgi:hypothetical protein
MSKMHEHQSNDAVRRLTSEDMLEHPGELVGDSGAPGHICSDSVPESTATLVRGGFQLAVKMLLIESNSQQ